MTFKEFWNRAKYVALNGQSRKFRVVKYIVLFTLAGVLYQWKGSGVVGLYILFLTVAGTCVHFFFRWKSNVWTK